MALQNQLYFSQQKQTGGVVKDMLASANMECPNCEKFKLLKLKRQTAKKDET